jgi:hypothetical protein
VAHALPHVEQFFGSLAVFVHAPPQSVGAVAWQPEPQVNVVPVDPGTHVGVAPLQVVEQPPQCAGSDKSVSQPLSGLASQLA